MADAPENCPFCGEGLFQPSHGLNYRHPDNACFIGDRVVVLNDIAAWNTRATPPASVVEAMEKAMDRQVRNCPVCKGKGTAVSGYELLTYHKHGRTEPVEEPCNWCSAGRIATAALTAWRDAQ